MADAPDLSDAALQRIVNKCEQYWNEPGIGIEEVHAILEFIHREASAVAAALRQRAADHAMLRRIFDGKAEPGERCIKCGEQIDVKRCELCRAPKPEPAGAVIEAAAQTFEMIARDGAVPGPAWLDRARELRGEFGGSDGE